MSIEADDWQMIPGRVVRGHGVASGQGGDPRFPGGTIRMQLEAFRARGLELSAYFPGTINVSIAPARYEVLRPRLTFRAVRWHPTQPPEDFSFLEVRVDWKSKTFFGLVYHPHPDTKPEHFQSPETLELLLPHLDGLRYDDGLLLAVPREQMGFANTGGSVLE